MLKEWVEMRGGGWKAVLEVACSLSLNEFSCRKACLFV